MTNCSLLKVETVAECPHGAFCNTFDLHSALIGLENQFVVFLRVAVLHRFYCTVKPHHNLMITIITDHTVSYYAELVLTSCEWHALFAGGGIFEHEWKANLLYKFHVFGHLYCKFSLYRNLQSFVKNKTKPSNILLNQQIIL